MQTHRQDVESTPTAATDRTGATTYDPYSGRRSTSIKLTQAIYLIFGLIAILLLVHFPLRALAANAAAGFAQVVSAITGVLVGPFVGLGTPQIAAGAALELSTLVALIVYAGIGSLLARAAWLIVGEAHTGSVASVSSKYTRVG